MNWFNRKKKPEKKVVENPDGSRTIETTFELTGDPRPVRGDVVENLDAALSSLGGEVLHAIDPARLLDFDQGGPSVWSVGIVEVSGDSPYTLLLTYGFSHILSPAPFREGINHEYSIAVPAGTNPLPWADALLRHLTKYVLKSGRDLEVGQVMPCFAPITYIPFPHHAHSSMPSTELVGLAVARDPQIASIDTAHGKIEVRRLVGLHQAELDRAETWSPHGFMEEYLVRDSLLLTDLSRPDAMEDSGFRSRVDERAEREGSEIPAFVLNVYWQMTPSNLEIEFPGGREAQKLLDALQGRLSFGQPFTVICREAPPIHFVPSAEFAIDWSSDGLTLHGTLENVNIAGILEFVRPDAPLSVVRIPLS